MNTPEQIELFKQATKQYRDIWIPACGGTETPFETRGRKLLYCFNPAKGRHAYLDMGSDLILSDEDAFAILS